MRLLSLIFLLSFGTNGFSAVEASLFTDEFLDKAMDFELPHSNPKEDLSEERIDKLLSFLHRNLAGNDLNIPTRASLIEIANKVATRSSGISSEGYDNDFFHLLVAMQVCGDRIAGAFIDRCVQYGEKNRLTSEGTYLLRHKTRALVFGQEFLTFQALYTKFFSLRKLLYPNNINPRMIYVKEIGGSRKVFTDSPRDHIIKILFLRDQNGIVPLIVETHTGLKDESYGCSCGIFNDQHLRIIFIDNKRDIVKKPGLTIAKPTAYPDYQGLHFYEFAPNSGEHADLSKSYLASSILISIESVEDGIISIFEKIFSADKKEAFISIDDSRFTQLAQRIIEILAHIKEISRFESLFTTLKLMLDLQMKKEEDELRAQERDTSLDWLPHMQVAKKPAKKTEKPNRKKVVHSTEIADEEKEITFPLNAEIAPLEETAAETLPSPHDTIEVEEAVVSLPVPREEHEDVKASAPEFIAKPVTSQEEISLTQVFQKIFSGRTMKFRKFMTLIKPWVEEVDYNQTGSHIVFHFKSGRPVTLVAPHGRHAEEITKSQAMDFAARIEERDAVLSVDDVAGQAAGSASPSKKGRAKGRKKP